MIQNQLKEYSNKDYPFEFLTRVDFLETSLIVNYKIKGDLSSIDLGPLNESSNRIIGLWKKSCFELFLRSGNPQEYLEFNLSPNGDWNCFIFNEEINELTEYNELLKIDFTANLKDDEFTLELSIDRNDLPVIHRDFQNVEFSTTSVLLINDGDEVFKESFWAINHCDTRPNFHHPDSYIRNN